MQGDAHIKLTLDLVINFWLIDICLRDTKQSAFENSLKKFYGRYLDLIRRYQSSVKDISDET